MSKTLVIAEKPSVAADIARVLGKCKKEKDFFENDEFVISSAIGHLVEICAPENEEVKKGKWKIENLPVIPSHFDLRPIERTEDRFKVLKKLIHRKDIDLLINACDAGREGELIFRYITHLAEAKKPIKRLWLQSMTTAAIKEKFSKLRTDEEMLPLADAAMCRSEADWLIGINGTRALTSFNSQGGGFQKTTVGRVQTPTLAVLVQREKIIKNFKPKPYWEVFGSFQSKQGLYEGRWFDEQFKKPSDEENNDHKAERIWDEQSAIDIQKRCEGKPATVEEESKPSTQLSPLLYDLTSLQREANGRFGFPARMTLSIAQALYEKHKAVTYPRTDSRYLPDDYLGTVRQILQNLNSPYKAFAGKVLESSWVKPNRRIFNQEKVSDHFAIIPTPQAPDKLSEPEAKIYDMITRRFLAVFYPAAVYEVTTRITRIDQDAFKTEGKVLKEPGWRAVYGQDIQDDEVPVLVPVASGESVKTEEVRVESFQTKHPPRFSEATLLSAMEGAGKFVEDEELREAMSEKGLGTPATRAAIIEGLIFEKYVLRQGRELIPTPKAFHLIQTLEAIRIQSLSSPELTGEWEYKLKLIEQNKLKRQDFMTEIQEATRSMVNKIRYFDPDQISFTPVDLKDPFSGQPMFETLRDYRTMDGSLVIRKGIAGRVMTIEEIQELLKNRQIGPLDGFISKMGRPFSASVKLLDDKKVDLDWGKAPSEDETISFEGLEPVGTCPKDQARVFQVGSRYLCENCRNESAKCDFGFSTRILNQEITLEQAKKLLNEGKTDVLNGFVSQRTRRGFKAHLIIKDGKVAFEFPPREPKAKGKGGARKKKEQKPESDQ